MKAGKVAEKSMTIPSSTTVGDAIELMSKNRLREIVLVEEDRMVGMVTIRSLIGPGIKEDAEVSKFAFMPPVVGPEEDVNKVIYELVDIGLESIPVLDNLTFKGIVTSNKILDAKKVAGEVKDAMVDAITVNKSDSVSKARNILMINKINRLPVLEKNKLVGIITSSDIARRVFLSKYGRFHGHQAEEPDLDQPVSKFMTSPVITIGPENKLEEAKKIMLDFNLRALPVVVGEQHVVGILCRLDILKKIAPKVSGVRIFFSGLEKVPEESAVSIEEYAKEQVRELAMTGKTDRVEIILKGVAESVCKAVVKAGDLEETAEKDDCLSSVKKAFKKMMRKLK